MGVFIIHKLYNIIIIIIYYIYIYEYISADLNRLYILHLPTKFSLLNIIYLIIIKSEYVLFE